MSSAPVTPPGIFPAPPGVTPNYTNPEIRSFGIVPLGALFTTLSTIVLALRLYTKARIIRIFGWDDISITVGWMSTVALAGIWIRSIHIGNGAHLWNMTAHNFVEYNLILTSSVIISVLAAGLPRVSVLLFYLRLNPEKGFRYSTLAVLTMTCASIIIYLGIFIFPCQPVKKLFYPFIEGKCIGLNDVYFSTPIISLILDFLIIVIPIPMVIHLQVNLRTKLVLMAIFAVSSCTVATSTARIYYSKQLRGSDDNSWNTMLPLSLGLVEYNLSIICTCVMVLRPFCRKHLPFFLGSDGTYRSGRSGDSPAAKGALNFDGPSGPNSKSGYRTKVSSGTKSGLYGDPMRSGKRSLWSGLGSSTIKDDYEDLESLSIELKAQDHRANRSDRPKDNDSAEYIGAADEASIPGRYRGPGNTHNGGADRYGPEYLQQVRDESGILKTVSLDVR